MNHTDIINERIRLLRKEMVRSNIDIYIIPSTDFHNSEYVGDYFKCREYITGFTGSAGTAVITREKAGLWTDGRYFLQAETQLKGTEVALYRSGEPNVPTVHEFVKTELRDHGVIGFDGRTIGLQEGKQLQKIVDHVHGSLHYTEDLIGKIWTDRPQLPEDDAFLLDISITGESAAQKLERVRGVMKEKGAEVHFLSSLDDIAWLLNIRGNDIAFCPLVLSYLLVYTDKAILFTDRRKFSEKLLHELESLCIEVKPYDEIEKDLVMLDVPSILLDPSCVSYSFYKRIPENTLIIESENPEIEMKAVKNDVEINNIKKAHIKDGVAYCKFLYWLYQNLDQCDSYTEISLSEILEKFRKEQEGYLEPSFAPICALGEHGAIVHYSATTESDLPLKKGTLLLMDTGGHYMQGSTDITRTISLGEIPDSVKSDVTLVLKAMLRLMNTTFMEGCSGANLDCIAREVFWKAGKNYNHGTGHGVGNLLNVHEGPINFRYKEGVKPAPALQKNMIITDEPGLYVEGAYGIRIENVLLVEDRFKNEYGQFMGFQPLTLVPIDLNAISPEEMSQEEKQMLNEYHSMVFETISEYLTVPERQWLKEYTRKI